MDKTQYNFSEREKYWQNFWEKEGVFHFDPNSKKLLFTIDTPPPTVSGALHLGHVFSYTQAEVVVRFFRIAGYNVRYPVGFDNNGLPTERLVEKEKGILGKDLKLSEFIKICYQVIGKYHKIFENLFKSLGFSIDWRLTYSTISQDAQKLAQTVFDQLHKNGQIYRKASPALYCPECGTPVAQAEVEDREKEGVFYDVVFRKKDGGELTIATTRPELIPACVAVFVHPKDVRYSNLIGKMVETPFGVKVPVKTDQKVEMEKGTGAVMCCTYGDETDVFWAKAYNLPEKIIIDKEGKFKEVANLPQMSGKGIAEGRGLIVSELRKRRLIKKAEKIVHDVGVHERCGAPIEIINITQWFIKILDKKDKLLKAGKKINWYPEYMQKRYADWVENLRWDWAISRDRFFGIPIPVYICKKCDEIIIPPESEFPIDPRQKKYAGSCPKCGDREVVGENKVLDTWVTSSLTPDINNSHSLNGELKGKMYPMTMRPNAHDIIRTWDLYTIIMGLFRHDDIPWRDLMISGHILAKKGQKISKKTGGAESTPEELIAAHSADAIRFAMCSANLGRDSYFDEGEVQMGKKLVTKIYNAAKFALSHLTDFKPQRNFNGKLEAVDLWILDKVRKTAAKMEAEFKKYEIATARATFEDFFWNDFCDNYLEIVKNRLYGTKNAKRKSAQFTLYHTFLSILKMASPFIPHITEEIYQANRYFAKNEKEKSIHISLWPKEPRIKVDKKLKEGAELMLKIISQVRKYKSEKKLGLGTQISNLGISCSSQHKVALNPFLEDIKGVTRAEKINFIGQKTTRPSGAELLVTFKS